MAFRCEKCGKRLGSKAELPGHLRRAHSGASPPRSASPGRDKTRVLRPTSTRSEIVRPERESVAGRLVRSQIVKVETARPDPRFYPPQTALAQREERMRERSALARREGPQFSSRDSEVSEALLMEQYWILLAMRSRLARGAGGPGDRERFLAALDVYKRNGERLRVKLLPAPSRVARLLT